MSDTPEINKDAARTYGIAARPAHVWGTWPPTGTSDATLPGAVQRTTVRAILVIDQSPVRRSLLSDLRNEPDLDIVGEANNAAAGLALAEDQHPDIVVMDVEMAGMDGVQATETLHALAPDCVIMLLTARDTVDTHERGRAAGARVVLQKGNQAIFRNTFHDLVQFVKARNIEPWPEPDALLAPADDVAAAEAVIVADDGAANETATADDAAAADSEVTATEGAAGNETAVAGDAAAPVDDAAADDVAAADQVKE